MRLLTSWCVTLVIFIYVYPILTLNQIRDPKEDTILLENKTSYINNNSSLVDTPQEKIWKRYVPLMFATAVIISVTITLTCYFVRLKKKRDLIRMASSSLEMSTKEH